MRTNYYFPIETINRELDWRLSVAVRHASRERRFFIGQGSVIHLIIPFMPQGVYLGKDVMSQETTPVFHESPEPARYRAVKMHGHRVLFLEEEGAFFPGGIEELEYWLGKRAKVEAMESEDFICSWGEAQTEFYRRKNPGLREHVRTTGHPRFDLLKPKYRSFYRPDARELQERYGRFVLVNTNFTLANHAIGHSHTFSRWQNYKPEEPDTRIEHIEKWNENTKVLADFVSLVHKASAEFPSVTFVLRYHPSENPRFYREVFGGVPNVEVVHSGSVGPWILASELVIHNNCTTAVEGRLADRPVLTYLPEGRSIGRGGVPNQMGVRATTEEDALESIEQALDCSGEDALCRERSPDARRLLSNFKHDESTDRIVELLEQAEEQVAGLSIRDRLSRFGEPDYWRWRSYEFRSVLRGLPEKATQIRDDKPLKFYGFDDDAIAEKVSRLEELFDTSVEFRVLTPALMTVTGT